MVARYNIISPLLIYDERYGLDEIELFSEDPLIFRKFLVHICRYPVIFSFNNHIRPEHDVEYANLKARVSQVSWAW